MSFIYLFSEVSADTTENVSAKHPNELPNIRINPMKKNITVTKSFFLRPQETGQSQLSKLIEKTKFILHLKNFKKEI